MSLGKFAINVVIVFVLYGLFMVLSGMVFTESMAAMMSAKRPEGAAEAVYVMPGHFIQTLAFVWLWGKAVTDVTWKNGAIFGAVFGLILMGTDMAYYGDFAIPAEAAHYSMINNVVVSALVGAVLALVQGFLPGGNADD